MGKYTMLFIGLAALCASVHGQATFMLSGTVADEYKMPLPGAAVQLSNSLSTSTDSNGRYTLARIATGTYVAKISFVGYETRIDTIAIGGNVVRSYQLVPATHRIQEVLVGRSRDQLRRRSDPSAIEVVSSEYLRENRGGSLMQSLDRVPGVAVISIGSGQSKPVIRGLGFNRVVVSENGIKHEGQQWGADHGLEIDQYAADNVEVVKGPSSLMYGSDAIGGVIDVRAAPMPASDTVAGVLDLVGKSNNGLAGGSLHVNARRGKLFAGARITGLYYADYRVPTDSVDIYSYRASLHEHRMRNTAGQEQNLHFTLGRAGRHFTSSLIGSVVSSKSGFFANAHGLEPRQVDAALHDATSRDMQFPRQEARHIKLIGRNQWQRENIRLDADWGVQRNRRTEYSQYVSHGYMPAVFHGGMAFAADTELELDKYIYSAQIKASADVSEKATIAAGASADMQDNRIGGRAFIIPAYRQQAAGAFVLGKYRFNPKHAIQAGLRWDYGHIEAQSYTDWFASASADGSWQALQRSAELQRTFSNSTWSIGYNYNAGRLSVKLNAGKSFRMPIAKELAANGVNYHQFSYEVGDRSLSPEVSYQFDAGAQYSGERFVIAASPFASYFTNYIYLNPTAEHDRLYGNGNQVFRYTQSEVLRLGGEWSAQYQLWHYWEIGAAGEYVHSQQTSGAKRGYTLPFSPPASGTVSIAYRRSQWRKLSTVYGSAECVLTAAQSRLVPPERFTPGSRIANVSAGAGIPMGKRYIVLSVQLQNVFNTKYFNHTSYYRLINVPEPGRNLVVNISVPLGAKVNQNQ